jgi:hypothetical protein
MSSRLMLCGAVALAAVLGCKIGLSDKQDGSVAAATSESVPGIVGTYVAADSGNTLGKRWCYSGALVLDSTGHFGSVLTMCGDNGGPVTEHLKGTYHFKTVTTRASRRSPAVKAIDVVLNTDGRTQTHTLRYEAGALRFDEPWWLGAGLRALDIPDPLLKKVAASALVDSTAAATASSTPALAARSSIPRPGMKSATKAAATR